MHRLAKQATEKTKREYVAMSESSESINGLCDSKAAQTV
jgi:hypothetical protein